MSLPTSLSHPIPTTLHRQQRTLSSYLPQLRTYTLAILDRRALRLTIANLINDLCRRGYATASAAQGAALARTRTMRIGNSAKEEIGRSGESSWVPDPVTGYYMPANRAAEIDGAELRELLLKQGFKSH